MSDILDAPGVPCVNCDLTICGEPKWLGEAGPLCSRCEVAYLDTFSAADQERIRREPATSGENISARNRPEWWWHHTEE